MSYAAAAATAQLAPARLRAMHVITALNVGGAERMLKKVATGLAPADIDIRPVP